MQLFVILLLQKAEKKTIASTEKQASVTKQDLSFSVSFTEVGAFGNVRKLSAFLHNGEMVACGTGSPDGALLPDLKGMNLATGDVSNKRQQLPQRMKNFAIQTLNIPQAFVEQGMPLVYHTVFFVLLLHLHSSFSVCLCLPVCLSLSVSVSVSVSLDFLIS